MSTLDFNAIDRGIGKPGHDARLELHLMTTPRANGEFAEMYLECIGAAADRDHDDHASAVEWLEWHRARGERCVKRRAGFAPDESAVVASLRDYTERAAGMARSFEAFETTTKAQALVKAKAVGWAKSYIRTSGAPQLKSGRSIRNLLLFAERPGVGKSHLGYAALHAIAASGDSDWMAISADEWLRVAVDARRGSAEDRAAVNIQRAQMQSAGVLLIDDLGVQTGSRAQLEEIYSVVDGRLARGLCTIITSNATGPEGLCGSAPVDAVAVNRIVSRIGESSLAVQFGEDWQDRRATR